VSANIGQGRVVKVCDLCAGVDDHPRHVIVGAIPGAQVVAQPTEDMVDRVIEAAPNGDRARLLRDLMDTSSSEHHVDCGAAAGCYSCGLQAVGAPGRPGAPMLKHLTSLGDVAPDDPGIVKAERN
jgi:hypothetical protein